MVGSCSCRCAGDEPIARGLHLGVDAPPVVARSCGTSPSGSCLCGPVFCFCLFSFSFCYFLGWCLCFLAHPPLSVLLFFLSSFYFSRTGFIFNRPPYFFSLFFYDASIFLLCYEISSTALRARMS